jgi:hypothetical protein
MCQKMSLPCLRGGVFVAGMTRVAAGNANRMTANQENRQV